MEKRMETQDLFIKNVSQWAAVCPREAAILPTFDPKGLSLCQTGEGEWNIRGEAGVENEYYHPPGAALEEARNWFKSLDLYGIGTLFVYGVGLGYDYLAAKEWLSGGKDRSLIFLEDDLRVINLLFQTETGKEMVFNKQVRIQYFQQAPQEEDTESNLNAIPFFYMLCSIRFSALRHYSKKDPDKLPLIEIQLEYIKNCKGFYLLEYLNYGETFFQNFYRNLLELPTAKLADGMFGKFAGIPAIICGAGPSLEKHLPLLEHLSNHALIFAGSSSINVLNGKNILPHFGVSIDPNWNQYARLFMNQAFQVPFFYRNRIFPQALSLIQGDRLYVTGSGGHRVSEYFEQKLGIPEGKKVQEGNNVVNFSLSIAEALGCNPIILIGVDLAYTNNQSYSPGILSHPILDATKGLATRSDNEELATKRDIYGNKVYTLWKWINESMWISRFALTAPRTEIVNATEGGIGFDGVPNFNFSEVIEKRLAPQMDLKTFLHGEIQNAVLPQTATKDNIIECMQSFDSSLKRCKELSFGLRQEFHKVLKKMKEEEKNPDNLVTEKAFGLLRELNQEIAYENILSEFNKAFIEFFGQTEKVSELEAPSGDFDPLKLNMKRALLNKRRYEFLKAVATGSEEYIHEALEVEKVTTLLSEVFGKEIEKAKALQGGKELEKESDSAIYKVEGRRFCINDVLLHASFDEELATEPVITTKEIKDFFSPKTSANLEGCIRLTYDSGKLKMEQFYKSGKLHGPVSYYAEDGKLLGKSWFINGLRQGASTNYYLSGDLYSIERYRDGNMNGKQEYYYSNGNIKSMLEFLNGKLDGKVILYFIDGLKKRELNFQEGKRHGAEIVWNLGGIKELEGTYHSDRPVGIFRSWYSKGTLSHEITYDESGTIQEMKAWSSDGTVVPQELLVKKDYFDLVQQETDNLTGSLENVYKEIESLSQGLSKFSTEKDSLKTLPDFTEDLKELKMEIENLKGINLEMKEEGESISPETAEAIWKTPEAKRLMGMQIQQAADKMAEDIKSLEEVMRLTAEFLSKQKKEKGEGEKH